MINQTCPRHHIAGDVKDILENGAESIDVVSCPIHKSGPEHKDLQYKPQSYAWSGALLHHFFSSGKVLDRDGSPYGLVLPEGGFLISPVSANSFKPIQEKGDLQSYNDFNLAVVTSVGTRFLRFTRGWVEHPWEERSDSYFSDEKKFEERKTHEILMRYLPQISIQSPSAFLESAIETASGNMVRYLYGMDKRFRLERPGSKLSAEVLVNNNRVLTSMALLHLNQFNAAITGLNEASVSTEGFGPFDEMLFTVTFDKKDTPIFGYSQKALDIIHNAMNSVEVDSKRIGCLAMKFIPTLWKEVVEVADKLDFQRWSVE